MFKQNPYRRIRPRAERKISASAGFWAQRFSVLSAGQAEKTLDFLYTGRYIEPMKQDSYSVILDAACALFALKGYDNSAVQDVCERAGLTKPSLYYQFGSKAGLLEALIAQRGKPLRESIAAAAEYRHDFQGTLTGILAAALAFARKDTLFFRLHRSLSHAPPESEAHAIHLPFDREIASYYEKLFVQSAAEFGNMRGKETLYAVLFRNAALSAAFADINGQLAIDEAAAGKIIHSFIYGVANG